MIPRSFQTTRWSLVQRATSSYDPTAMSALAALCEAYWHPIYACIRHAGPTPPRKITCAPATSAIGSRSTG
jgi:RNA polymerase sigma-70 factor (ECF subfamily)